MNYIDMFWYSEISILSILKITHQYPAHNIAAISPDSLNNDRFG